MLRQWWVSWVGVGVMVTFLDVARMVDATAMMSARVPDPSARVPELPSSPEEEAQESAVPDIGPQGSSLTISARGHMFENLFLQTNASS